MKIIYALMLSFSLATVHAQALRTKKISSGSRVSGKIQSKSSRSGFISAGSPYFEELERTRKELKELKERKDWSAWVFHEAAPIFSEEDGFDIDSLGGFSLFALNYNAGWRFNPSLRAAFLNSYSSVDTDGNDRELITALDPHIQFAGTTFSTSKFTWTNWFRASIPLSERSVDSGLITQLRVRTGLSYDIGNKWSVSFINWVVGSFFGFSQGEDSIGSTSFEIGAGGPINDLFGVSFSYTTGASREDGIGLGFLDFAGGNEALNFILDLRFIKFISTQLVLNIPVDQENNDYDVRLWLFKSLF